MRGLSSSWVDTIGWMLLHSLWQGAAVGLALALVLRLPHRVPAQARYLAACVAMSLMIVLPVAAVRRLETIPSVVPTPRAIERQPPRAEEPADPEVYSTLALRPWRARIVLVFPAIVGLWMTGAGVLSLRLLGGWASARRWVRRDTRPLICPWIDRLKERMGIRRAVALLVSARVEVPMVVGWLRPAILVPIAAFSGLTAPEMEAILAHELAHIRRHDYLVNVLQCVVEILVFYHPATWWITRVIRREREHCCDDIAVAVSRDRLTYARALAAMEGLRTPLFSLSPAANGGNLLARVRRILKPEEESMKPVCSLTAISLAVVVVSAASGSVVAVWAPRAHKTTLASAPQARGQIGKLSNAKISEGMRFQVRNVVIEGNTRIKAAVLREGMELHSGKPYLLNMRDADKNRILTKYNKIGCIDAKVSVEPWFTSQPGVIDLLYRISEGEPYLLGELEVLKDHDHDKIDDAEAEKTFRVGVYYKRIGRAGSAKFYFGKILRRWPNSPWAVKARAQFQADPKPADRTRVEYFNFLLGGFY